MSDGLKTKGGHEVAAHGGGKGPDGGVSGHIDAQHGTGLILGHALGDSCGDDGVDQTEGAGQGEEKGQEAVDPRDQGLREGTLKKNVRKI